MARLEQLLTAREAAALLAVRLSTLYTWAGRGQIPVQRVGRCLRFDPAALHRWLEHQRRDVGPWTRSGGAS